MDPDPASQEGPQLGELIGLAQAGDRSAQDRLFSHYYPAVVEVVKARMGRFLRGREESADVAQSVFRQVIESDAFARGRFDGPDAFGRWLARVVENKLVDHARALGAAKRGAGRTVRLDAAPDDTRGDGIPATSPEASPSQIVARDEEWRRLKDLIPHLPSPLHAEVLRLHLVEGLATPAIAARLRIDDRQVRRLRAESVAVLIRRQARD